MRKVLVAKDIVVYLLTAMFYEYARLAADAVSPRQANVSMDLDNFVYLAPKALRINRVLARVAKSEVLDQTLVRALRRLCDDTRGGLCESWHWRTLDCLLAGRAVPDIRGDELERKVAFERLYAQLMGALPPQV